MYIGAIVTLFWPRGVLLFLFLFIIQDRVLNQGQECENISTPKLHRCPDMLKGFHNQTLSISLL